MDLSSYHRFSTRCRSVSLRLKNCRALLGSPVVFPHTGECPEAARSERGDTVANEGRTRLQSSEDFVRDLAEGGVGSARAHGKLRVAGAGAYDARQFAVRGWWEGTNCDEDLDYEDGKGNGCGVGDGDERVARGVGVREGEGRSRAMRLMRYSPRSRAP